MLSGLAGIGSCPLNAQDGRGGRRAPAERVRGLSDHAACRTWARLEHTGIAAGQLIPRGAGRWVSSPGAGRSLPAGQGGDPGA